MKLELSDVCIEECERAARGVGLSLTAWVEAMLFRVARMQGIPAGVIDPSFHINRAADWCPPEVRTAKALEQIAARLESWNTNEGGRLDVAIGGRISVENDPT